MKKLGIVALALALIAPMVAFTETDDSYGALGALAGESMSLQQMLIYAIQDEYLARSEYAAIMDEFGSMRPFSNIMLSEENHIEWLIELFDEYAFPLPIDDAVDHVVIPGDLKTAFQTGVKAEIDNIAMYEKFLSEDLPEDVRDVFGRLQRASENHLRAFQNNLKRYE